MGRGGTKQDLSGAATRADASEWKQSQIWKQRVSAAAAQIARLGEWGDHIDLNCLDERVPTPDQPASGFDAGIACALDLIPRNKQRLSAKLHAAYTPEAVQQVQSEASEMRPDSQTCWWLAACSVCTEGRVSVSDFQQQLSDFEVLRTDAAARVKAAVDELSAMRNRFEIKNGIAYSTVDGGMQGAYLSGHQIAVSFDPDEQLYFIGTYQPTLGLEKFVFSDETDQRGRPRSGPVHGSQQYVKCTDEAELTRALDEVPSKLKTVNLK